MFTDGTFGSGWKIGTNWDEKGNQPKFWHLLFYHSGKAEQLNLIWGESEALNMSLNVIGSF